MKIAFIGDSITEGFPGVSYVNILKTLLPKSTLLNYGLGGDTVSSLYRRVKEIQFDKDIDVVVLFVGVNDVFGRLTPTYEKLKTKYNQIWAKDRKEFRNQYIELLDFVKTLSKKVIIIPPLVLGEEKDNKWNIEIGELVEELEDILVNYPDFHYINVRDMFFNVLKEVEVSSFLPINMFRMLLDVKFVTTIHKIDEKSKKRKLHLTLDGVHLNSLGASLVANAIFNKIEVIWCIYLLQVEQEVSD